MLENKREESLDKIERNLQLEIRSIQRTIKLLAVIVPPIPPAIVGLIVFAVRRMREREGVAKTRLR